jgi:hypothetical protein
MASIPYINAAFDSIMHDLPGLIRLLPDIPFVDEQHIALQKIQSQEGRVIVLKLLKNAIAAGEAADRKKES